jgi:Family of unknown function (DUF5641)
MPMFSTVPNDQVYMEAASTRSEENEKILFEQKNVDFVSTFKVDNHPTSDCDQFVVTSSVDDGDSSPAEPVEAGELIEAAFGAETLDSLRNDGVSERTQFDQCVVANSVWFPPAPKEFGDPIGREPIAQSVEAEEEFGERIRTDSDQFVVSNKVVDDTLKKLASVEADRLPGELDRADLDQCVVNNRIKDVASMELTSVEADGLPGDLDRANLDQYVVSNNVVDDTLKKLASVEADRLPGELDRADLDQCVVNNRTGDVASMELTSVEADGLPGDLDRANLDQYVVGHNVMDGVSCPLAPMEVGELIGTVPIALTAEAVERSGYLVRSDLGVQQMERQFLPRASPSTGGAQGSAIGTVGRALLTVAEQRGLSSRESESMEVDAVAGEMSRPELARCSAGDRASRKSPPVETDELVSGSVDVGDSSPVPVEAGQPIRAATGAESLGPVRTDRTHFGQFVVSKVVKDVASKEQPSVDAAGPHGTFDRVEQGQPAAKSVVKESGRLASMKAGVCTGAAQHKRHVVPQISSNLSGARSFAITERQSEKEETLVSSFSGLLGLPSGVFSNNGYNWRRRWRVARYQVRKRRLKRYAPASMVRCKWTTLKWELTYDEIAVIDRPCLVRGQWLTGVIEEVLPGSDGVVRTVGVKTGRATGVLRRPAAKVLFVSAMWSRHGVENVAAVSNP